MIVFKTETGSIYEYDEVAKRIRRISGVNPTTKRCGQEGEWTSCSEVTQIEVGCCALINWSGTHSPSIPGAIPLTITSRIVEITKL